MVLDTPHKGGAAVKLDAEVCRGSLIVHSGVTFVVLGKGGLPPPIRSANPEDWARSHPKNVGWRILPVDKVDMVRYDKDWVEVIRFDKDVDSYFPGPVYDLPDAMK